jgi:Tfp pilus assembly protein PilZ
MTPKLVSHDPKEPLSDMSFAEKRRHRRVQLSIRCWMGDATHTIYLRVHDVSLGGLSVRAPVPFEPDRDLQLSIELPDRSHVRARGKVVWVSPPTGLQSRPRMGARFVEFIEGEEALSALLTTAS